MADNHDPIIADQGGPEVAEQAAGAAAAGGCPVAHGRVHPTQKGPVNASMLVTVIVGLYMLAFTLSDSSTEAALLKLGTWTPLMGVLVVAFMIFYLHLYMRKRQGVRFDRAARILSPPARFSGKLGEWTCSPKCCGP